MESGRGFRRVTEEDVRTAKENHSILLEGVSEDIIREVISRLPMSYTPEMMQGVLDAHLDRVGNEHLERAIRLAMQKDK